MNTFQLGPEHHSCVRAPLLKHFSQKLFKPDAPARASYRSEVHDFEDPDRKSQVDYHGDKEEEDEEVQASLPPAVDPHGRIDLGAAHRRPPLVERVGLCCEDVLLLCHLEKEQSPKVN